MQPVLREVAFQFFQNLGELTFWLMHLSWTTYNKWADKTAAGQHIHLLLASSFFKKVQLHFISIRRELGKANLLFNVWISSSL